MNNWTADDIIRFRNALIKTINWTAYLSKDFDLNNRSYADVFRVTSPKIGKGLLYCKKGEDVDWGYDADYNVFEQLLNDAMMQRPEAVSNRLTEGRILSFETLNTGCDGAASMWSKYFIDLNDVPPIDTWFYISHNYIHNNYLDEADSQHVCQQALFCWIPGAFEEVVNDAIAVEIFDSYRWMDEDSPELYAKVIHSLARL